MTTEYTGSQVTFFPRKFKLVKILRSVDRLRDFVTSFVVLCEFRRFSVSVWPRLKSLAHSPSSNTTQLVSVEEFVLMYDVFPSKNPSFPYHEFARFDNKVIR